MREIKVEHVGGYSVCCDKHRNGDYEVSLCDRTSGIILDCSYHERRKDAMAAFDAQVAHVEGFYASPASAS